MRPDSLTVPTMVLVFTTAYMLKMLELFATEIVSDVISLSPLKVQFKNVSFYVYI